ncbi:hypothetical protein CLOP_g9609 [Closterium sp. NIES-67]|nr:hypothetical protein CLOP_g9609 [Closterium sp. NIES-67]
MEASEGLCRQQMGDGSDVRPREAACGCLPMGADVAAGYARLDARSLAATNGTQSPSLGGEVHSSAGSGPQQGEAGLREGECRPCSGSSSARQAGSEGTERNGFWRKRIVRMMRGATEEGGIAAGKGAIGAESAGDSARTWGREGSSWDVEAGRGAAGGEARARSSVFPYDWVVAPRAPARLLLQHRDRTPPALNPRPATPTSSASSASTSSPAWPSARPSAPAAALPPCQQPGAVMTSAWYEVVADEMEEEEAEEEEERMSDGDCTDDGLDATHRTHPLCCCCWPLLPPSPAPLPPASSRRSSRSSQAAGLSAQPGGNGALSEGGGHVTDDLERRRQGAGMGEGEARKGEARRGAVAWVRGMDWESRRCQLSIFAAVMLAGLAAAAVVFWATYRSYQQNSMSVLTTLCDTWAALLNERLDDSAKQARLLSALLSILYFRSNPPLLNQSMFSDFMRESRLSLHLFHNVAFALRLSPALRPAWEAANNATTPCIMDESRRCAGERREYAPIVFEELSHAPHRGLDLYHLGELNATVWRARQQLSAVVSPILAASHAPTAAQFSPAAASDAHVFKVLPVFRSARAYLPAAGDTGEEEAGSGAMDSGVGEGEVAGFVVAEMDVDGLWHDIIKAASPSADMVLQIVDVTDGSTPHLVLDASRQAYSAADQLAQGPFARVNSIDFGDHMRQYELRCRYENMAVPVLPVVWMVLVLVVVAGAAYLLCLAQKHLSVARRNLRRMGLLKDRMKRAKVLAEMGNRAKGTFLATMSHELRTPLNGVIGMMNLLLETPLSATQLDYVDTARTSGRALVDLINDILDLSKIEAKRMVLESASLDVRSDVVDDVLSMFVDRIRANPRVEVAAYVDPAVPALIFGDSLRLRQVLMNLLSNSCKYTARGHIFICVRAVRSDEDLRRVLLLRALTTPHAPPHHASAAAGPHDASAWRVVSPSALTRPPFSGPGARGGRLLRAYVGSGPLGAVGGVVGEGGDGEEGTESGGWASGRDGDSESVCGEDGRQSRERERERRGFETLSGYEAVESCNSWAHVRMKQQAMAAAAAAAAAQGARGGGEAGQGVAASSGMVRLVVSVEDTGEGIPLSAQTSVFKRFVQADASSTRTHGGTGIGLTISRHLVHLMGGKLSFVSRPGVGTTFYFDFTVPFQAPKTPAPPAAAAAVDGRAARAASSIDSCDCAFTAPPLSPATHQHHDAPYHGAAAASLGINCSSSPSLSLPPLQLMPPSAAACMPASRPVGEAVPSPARAAAAAPVPALHVWPCPAALTGPYVGVAAVVLDDWPVRRAVMLTCLARLGVTVLEADAHAHAHAPAHGHACMCHGCQHAAGDDGEGAGHGSAPAASAAVQGGVQGSMAAAAGSVGGPTEGACGGRAGVGGVSWEAVWAPRGMVVVVEHDWVADRGGLGREWRHKVEAAAGWVVQQYRRAHARAAAMPAGGGATNSNVAAGGERGRAFGLPDGWRVMVVLRDAREAAGLKQRHGVGATLIKPIRHSALAGCLGEALGAVGAHASHALPGPHAAATDAPAFLPLRQTQGTDARLQGEKEGEVGDESEVGEEAHLLPSIGSVGSSPTVPVCATTPAPATGLQQRSSSTSALAAMRYAGRGAHRGGSRGEGQRGVGERGGGGSREGARLAEQVAEAARIERVAALSPGNRGLGRGAAAGVVEGGAGLGRGAGMGGGRSKSAAAVRLCNALGGLKFLVVDDNMVNRKVISKMLQRYEVHVEAVEGGAQALQRLQQPHEFVGVFMDVQMPGMNGFQATRAIRQMEAAQVPATTAAHAPLPAAATAHHCQPLPPATAPGHAHPQLQDASPSAAAAAAGTPEAITAPPLSSPRPPAVSPCASPRPAPPKRLLVFALTADIGGGTRERCAVVGMDGYMTKPIEEDQLSNVVLPFFQPTPTAPHTLLPLAAGATAAAP